MLSRIHHIGIVVRNLEQAYGFWRDTLGLPIHKVATVKDLSLIHISEPTRPY